LARADALEIEQSSAFAYSRLVELYIKPALGHIPLQRLTVGDVTAFKANLIAKGGVRKKNLSPATIAKVMAVLSSALDYAYECGYINENVCRRVKRGKVKVAPRKVKVLNEAQTVQLIATARGSELYLPIIIAATTGMRRGEILALTWQDVDFEQGVIHVTQALAEVRGNVIVKGPKSYAGVRDITMPKLLMEELRLHRGEGNVCADVKPSTFSAQFSRWMKRVGLNVTFHGLRHGHFSQLIERGVNPKKVQERAGHASFATTMNAYVHSVQDDVASKVDEMLTIK
jgi:integrase